MSARGKERETRGDGADRGGPLSAREKGEGALGQEEKGNGPENRVGGPPENKSLFLLFKSDKFK